MFPLAFSPDKGSYEVVRPRFVSAERPVPIDIAKPPYYLEYQPPDMFTSTGPEIKINNKIERMRDSCRLAANILEKCSKIVQVRCDCWAPTMHSFTYYTGNCIC